MSEYPSLRRSRARIAQKVQTARILIKCFDDEKKTLQERARSANKSLSAYLRDCALSPIPLHSPVNPSPNGQQLETLPNSNVQEEEQTFVHQAIEAKKNGSEFSKQVESAAGGKDLASERTGHTRGCGCFACERLRAMLTSQSCDKQRKSAKSKRINAS